MENSVGFILARLRTTDGRLLATTINRSINDVKLRGLTSSEQVIDRIDFVLGLMDLRSKSVRKRFGIEAPEEESGLPRFRIKEDGTLEKVD